MGNQGAWNPSQAPLWTASRCAPSNPTSRLLGVSAVGAGASWGLLRAEREASVAQACVSSCLESGFSCRRM